MNPEVKIAEAMSDYVLKVQFTNDEVKELYVAPFLDKGVFSELKDEDYFRQVRVVFGSVEWLNEQDFSKDTLYLLGNTVST